MLALSSVRLSMTSTGPRWGGLMCSSALCCWRSTSQTIFCWKASPQPGAPSGVSMRAVDLGRRGSVERRRVRRRARFAQRARRRTGASSAARAALRPALCLGLPDAARRRHAPARRRPRASASLSASRPRRSRRCLRLRRDSRARFASAMSPATRSLHRARSCDAGAATRRARARVAFASTPRSVAAALGARQARPPDAAASIPVAAPAACFAARRRRAAAPRGGPAACSERRGVLRGCRLGSIDQRRPPDRAIAARVRAPAASSVASAAGSLRRCGIGREQRELLLQLLVEVLLPARLRPLWTSRGACDSLLTGAGGVTGALP